MKEWFVEYLMEMLLEEDSDHEDLTAPLLVIASVTKEDFKLKNFQDYTYEVWMTIISPVSGYTFTLLYR